MCSDRAKLSPALQTTEYDAVPFACGLRRFGRKNADVHASPSVQTVSRQFERSREGAFTRVPARGQLYPANAGVD
jgi:hypothetical protein